MQSLEIGLVAGSAVTVSSKLLWRGRGGGIAVREEFASGVTVTRDGRVVGFGQGREGLRGDLGSRAAFVAGCIDDLGVVEHEGAELDEADVVAEVLEVGLVVLGEGVGEHCCESRGVVLHDVGEGGGGVYFSFGSGAGWCWNDW